MTTQRTLFAEPDKRLITDAIFSPCRKWRYRLTRRWNIVDNPRTVAFIGLNPSTADETLNDPTVTRAIGFAKRWGMDGMFMLNLFAFRATDPRDMKAAKHPIGGCNDEAIQAATAMCEFAVLCWGTHGTHLNRSAEVWPALVNCPAFHFGLTQNGQPRHPLYLRGDSELIKA